MKSVNKIIIYSIYSLLLVIIAHKCLSPYAIKSIDGFSITISNFLNIIMNNRLELFKIIIGITTSILNIVISIICIKSIFSFESEESQIDIMLLKILLTLLFIQNCLILIFSVYLLIFILLFIFIILLIIPLFTFILSNGGGGPVHVRGHYRNGTYVRSHTRRRPRY